METKKFLEEMGIEAERTINRLVEEPQEGLEKAEDFYVKALRSSDIVERLENADLAVKIYQDNLGFARNPETRENIEEKIIQLYESLGMTSGDECEREYFMQKANAYDLARKIFPF